MKINKSIEKKNAIWNTLGTAINAFNSLFFMIIAVRINGSKIAGIFTYAFSISALFNMIGTYHGRVFQVTEISKFNDEDFFWNKILTCIIMVLLSFLFILLNQYDLEKALIISILSIYRTLEAFAEVLYAYFQKNEELYEVGISLVVKNILGLILFFIVDYFTKSILLASIALVINYFIIMLIYDMKSIKKYNINLKLINKTNVKEILKKGFYPFILAFVIQLLINVPRYIIDLKMPNDSAIWGILIMPATVMILIGQFCLAPFLIKLFNLYSERRIKEYLSLVGRICFFIFAGGIFAIFIAWILGIPVLNFVYGVDLSDYKISLIIIIFGAVFYGIQSVLYNLLVAMRYIRIQVYIYFGCIVMASLIFYFFIVNKGILGASIAYLLVTLLLFSIYLIVFIYYSLKNGGTYSGKS